MNMSTDPNTLTPPLPGPPPRTRPPPRRYDVQSAEAQHEYRNHIRRILVLLVLGDEILHVGLGFGELHLVHSFLRVPVKESLAPEHGSELVADTLEQLLNCR